jgi:hypothetical protein
VVQVEEQVQEATHVLSCEQATTVFPVWRKKKKT